MTHDMRMRVVRFSISFPTREPRVSASSARIPNTSVRSGLESTQIDFRSLPTTQCMKCLEIAYTTILHIIVLGLVPSKWRQL